MTLDVTTWRTVLVGIALCLAGCSSGLLSKPMERDRSAAPSNAGRAAIAGAGAAGTTPAAAGSGMRGPLPCERDEDGECSSDDEETD